MNCGRFLGLLISDRGQSWQAMMRRWKASVYVSGIANLVHRVLCQLQLLLHSSLVAWKGVWLNRSGQVEGLERWSCRTYSLICMPTCTGLVHGQIFYLFIFFWGGSRAAAACQKTSGSPVLSFFLIFLTKTLKYRDKRLLVFNTSETNGGLIVGCPPDASATAGLVVFASMRLTGSSEYCPSIAEHWCCPEHRNCTPVWSSWADEKKSRRIYWASVLIKTFCKIVFFSLFWRDLHRRRLSRRRSSALR